MLRLRATKTPAALAFLLLVSAWPLSGIAQPDDGSLSAEERRERLERQIQAAKERAADERRAEQEAAAQAAAAAEAEAARRRAADRAAAAERKAAADRATAELRAAQLEAAERAAADAAANEPFAKFRDCPECPEMIRIPAGKFEMGDLGAKNSGGDALPGRLLKALGGVLGNKEPKNLSTPVRTVEVPTFSIGRFEVTLAEWDACVDAGGCGEYRPADHGWGRGQQPVINVSWSQAQQYVLWLQQRTGRKYRLLSEAEWEYVARAGTKTAYSFGGSINCAQAHYGQLDGPCGSEQRSRPVGQFAANPWGVHDMHGNVWEWVQDCQNPNYEGAPGDATPRSRGDCSHRMYRGGGWSSGPDWLSSSARGDDIATARYYDLGVRLARSDD